MRHTRSTYVGQAVLVNTRSCYEKFASLVKLSAGSDQRIPHALQFYSRHDSLDCERFILKKVHTCNDAVNNGCKLFLAGPSIDDHSLANKSATSVSHSAPVGLEEF